jgi:hypothetical protein
MEYRKENPSMAHNLYCTWKEFRNFIFWTNKNAESLLREMYHKIATTMWDKIKSKAFFGALSLLKAPKKDKMKKMYFLSETKDDFKNTSLDSSYLSYKK